MWYPGGRDYRGWTLYFTWGWMPWFLCQRSHGAGRIMCMCMCMCMRVRERQRVCIRPQRDFGTFLSCPWNFCHRWTMTTTSASPPRPQLNSSRLAKVHSPVRLSRLLIAKLCVNVVILVLLLLLYSRFTPSYGQVGISAHEWTSQLRRTPGKDISFWWCSWPWCFYATRLRARAQGGPRWCQEAHEVCLDSCVFRCSKSGRVEVSVAWRDDVNFIII